MSFQKFKNKYYLYLPCDKGNLNKVSIIAEVGVNHNGKIEYAKKLVAVAKKATVIVKAPVKIVKKEIVKTVVKSKAKPVVKATSKIKRKTK